MHNLEKGIRCGSGNHSLLGFNNEGNIVFAGDLLKGGLFDLLK